MTIENFWIRKSFSVISFFNWPRNLKIEFKSKERHKFFHLSRHLCQNSDVMIDIILSFTSSNHEARLIFLISWIYLFLTFSTANSEVQITTIFYLDFCHSHLTEWLSLFIPIFHLVVRAIFLNHWYTHLIILEKNIHGCHSSEYKD